MSASIAGRMALFTAGVGAILVMSACNPQAAQQSAQNEAAEHARAQADARAQRQVGQASECISALRWQKDVLARAGVGTAEVYTAHYRAMLEKALGDTVIPAADGAPALSLATIDAYLEWAYPNDVKTKFTAGKDWNKDGTTTPRELNVRGYQRVASCVQQAAEVGAGPLAKTEKYARFLKLKALSDRLEDSD